MRLMLLLALAVTTWWTLPCAAIDLPEIVAVDLVAASGDTVLALSRTVIELRGVVAKERFAAAERDTLHALEISRMQQEITWRDQRIDELTPSAWERALSWALPAALAAASVWAGASASK